MAAGSPAPATREDWLRAVAGALKGAAPDAFLHPARPDGLAIAPLHARREGAPPLAGRPAGQRWRMAQRVDHPDAAQANALALADLEGGADSLVLVAAGAPTARGFGLADIGAAGLGRALAGVDLDLIGLRLEAGANVADAALGLLLAAADGGLAGALDLSVGYDPAGLVAAGGGEPSASALPALLEVLARAGHRGAVVTADGRTAHEAGATVAQELGFVLAGAVHGLRAMEAAGLPLAQAAERLDVVLAADAEVFVVMAKMRALRRLWTSVEAACGLDAKPIRLHAETSWRMLARRDPWTNLLRSSLAAFAAGAGGADSVAVLPFTAALGLPDAVARRTARNVQHVLMDEANLHRVADLAAGAGAIEALTDALCDAGWTFFQAIEAQGGILRAIASGWMGREFDMALAALPPPRIVGTTDFALPEETPAAVLAPRPAHAGARLLPSRRRAEPFEAAPP